MLSVELIETTMTMTERGTEVTGIEIEIEIRTKIGIEMVTAIENDSP